MAKTNPIGVRFKQENLDYLKKEHGVDSPQKALVFYERFFMQHHKLAKDITQMLRQEEKQHIPSDDEVKTKGAKRALVADTKTYPDTAKPTWGAKENEILAQIAEKEAEIKSPPKNPVIGLKMWLQSRYSDIAKLKAELKLLTNEHQ